MAKHLPTKNARRSGHLKNFFKCPGMPGCLSGGGYSRPELACTLVLYVRLIGTINAPINGKSRRGYGQGTGI